MSISVVVNTLNEESNIAQCLKSVENFADEIVVCDMNSDDKTVEIAKGLGAKVVLIERLEGAYQKMRYLGIREATQEWVLQLDADERLTVLLAEQLKLLTANPAVDVVRMGIKFWYFGAWVEHGGFYSTHYPRFFRKNVYMSNYQESILQVHADWSALDNTKNVVTLSSQFHLLHYAYPNIEKYISKTLGMYARIEGEQYFKSGRKFKLWRMVLVPIKTFLDRFIIKGGYKDGVRGIILAVLYAGYRFATWANVWLLENQNEKSEQVNA